METREDAAMTRATAKKTTTKNATSVEAKPQIPKKNPEKLRGRFALDFAAMRDDMLERAGMVKETAPKKAAATAEANPALLRLKALMEREQPMPAAGVAAPVNLGLPNWTPMGPLAIPNGQTYGGARVQAKAEGWRTGRAR